jgi:hypothetical protein
MEGMSPDEWIGRTPVGPTGSGEWVSTLELEHRRAERKRYEQSLRRSEAARKRRQKRRERRIRIKERGY